MRDSWETTQSKLRKWQHHSKSGWDLRKILSESFYFRTIAMCAALRAPNRSSQTPWQDWWAFHLEQLPERTAIDLLLDVWNVDIWEHIHQEALSCAHEILFKMQIQTQLRQDLEHSMIDFFSSTPLDSTHHQKDSDPLSLPPPKTDPKSP